MTVMYSKGFDQTIEKTDGTCSNGADNLFTITGGPILVTEFVGIVTTIIGDNIATCQIQHTTTEPAGTVNLSTAVAITSDAAGTSYTFTADATSVLTPTTVGTLTVIPRIAWVLPIGTLKATCSALNTGNIKWYMKYTMLSQYSRVAAA